MTIKRKAAIFNIAAFLFIKYSLVSDMLIFIM